MSPYGEFLGITILELADGKATCTVEIEDHHFNTGGRVHGGLLTSLADTAAGAAVRSVRPDGKLSATTDFSMAFIRPPIGKTLTARAEIIHAGRRLFRTEIPIYSDDKLVAKATATFMLVDAPKT